MNSLKTELDKYTFNINDIKNDSFDVTRPFIIGARYGIGSADDPLYIIITTK